MSSQRRRGDILFRMYCHYRDQHKFDWSLTRCLLFPIILEQNPTCIESLNEALAFLHATPIHKTKNHIGLWSAVHRAVLACWKVTGDIPPTLYRLSAEKLFVLDDARDKDLHQRVSRNGRWTLFDVQSLLVDYSPREDGVESPVDDKAELDRLIHGIDLEISARYLLQDSITLFSRKNDQLRQSFSQVLTAYVWDILNCLFTMCVCDERRQQSETRRIRAKLFPFLGLVLHLRCTHFLQQFHHAFRVVDKNVVPPGAPRFFPSAAAPQVLKLANEAFDVRSTIFRQAYELPVDVVELTWFYIDSAARKVSDMYVSPSPRDDALNEFLWACSVKCTTNISIGSQWRGLLYQLVADYPFLVRDTVECVVSPRKNPPYRPRVTISNDMLVSEGLRQLRQAACICFPLSKGASKKSETSVSIQTELDRVKSLVDRFDDSTT